jgi:predicted CoA-binding protein
MSKKKTLVMGASGNTDRYSNMAICRLRQYGHPVLAVGLKGGHVLDVEILIDRPSFSDVDTVTLYVGPQRLQADHEYILSLKPRRVIFNPGTEDDLFEDRLRNAGVEVVEGCTLVMLSTEQY